MTTLGRKNDIDCGEWCESSGRVFLFASHPSRIASRAVQRRERTAESRQPSREALGGTSASRMCLPGLHECMSLVCCLGSRAQASDFCSRGHFTPKRKLFSFIIPDRGRTTGPHGGRYDYECGVRVHHGVHAASSINSESSVNSDECAIYSCSIRTLSCVCSSQ